jgi:hypothetical protein
MSQYTRNRKQVDALVALLSIVQYFERNNKCLDNKKFTQAAAKLSKVQDALNGMKDTAMCDTKIYTSLRREVTIKREKLLHELDKAWKYAITWKNIVEDDEYSTAAPCLELKFSTREGGISAQDMVYSLALFNNLDYKLATFANNVVTRIFHPLIRNTNLTPFINENEKEGLASLELLEIECDVKQEISAEATTFKHVYDCLSFLHRNFFKLKVKSDGAGDAEDSLMRMLSDLTCERIMKLLIETCLERTVPDTKEELDKYDQVGDMVDKFEAALRSIDYLSTERGGLMVFCSNIDAHFANRRNTLILSNAKKMMKKDLLETIEVSNEVVVQLSTDLSTQLHTAAHGDDDLKMVQMSGGTATMNTDAIKLPSFRVSKFVMELMELVHVLRQAIRHSRVQSSCCQRYQVFWISTKLLCLTTINAPSLPSRKHQPFSTTIAGSYLINYQKSMHNMKDSDIHMNSSIKYHISEKLVWTVSCPR